MWAGVTTFSPLQKYSKPGSKCGIVGIGGLGHMGVQYAVKLGLKTYWISTSS